VALEDTAIALRPLYRILCISLAQKPFHFLKNRAFHAWQVEQYPYAKLKPDITDRKQFLFRILDTPYLCGCVLFYPMDVDI